MMNVTLWGTRGSIPVWGAKHMRHGGATTCVEIVLEDADADTPSRVVIDLGTGAAELGRARKADWDDTLFLQTHMHWDHIQGFPFLGALFEPSSRLRFMSVDRDGQSLSDVLGQQMRPPTFPIGLEMAPATLEFESVFRTGTREVGDLKLSWDEMWHPSGSTAWRLDYRGASIVFSGDVELRKGGGPQLLDLAAGADLLIADAQYFESEYQSRIGWGHSTPKDAVEVALEAGVERLVLTHHDPVHDDAALDQKQAEARRHAQGRLQVDNAFDSMTIHLAPSSRLDLAS